MLDGIRNYLGKDVEVIHEKGCAVTDAMWPASQLDLPAMTEEESSLMKKAVDAASDADVIIAVMGENDDITGESRSQTSLELPGHQRELLKQLHATGKPVILVLINGQPLTINWENDNLPAIIEAWFPNSQGGVVLAETLFGENNPSGKLTVTFPKSIGQIEYNFPYKKGSHGAQNSSGPNGSGNTRVIGALYPFGYGLSYTTFEYSDLVVNKNEDNSVDITLNVRNMGARKGTEVVELYVRDCYSSVVTYDSVLRGFERVTLEPGQQLPVHFKLAQDAMEILGKDMKWVVEPGDFEVLVGASSEDIRLKGGFTIE